MAVVAKRAYFDVEKTDVTSGGVVTSCTVKASGNPPGTSLQYMFSGQSEWQEYPEEGILVSSKGQTGISLRAHPDVGNRDYEDYQIDVTVAYVDRYEVGEYEGSQNVTNDYVEPSTRMAYGSSGAPYFEKCEYRGYHSDSSGTKWGLYANPARYKAEHITRYDMLRKNLLPSTVQGSRTSILNFYDSGGQKIEQIMIRAKYVDAANDNGQRVFPSDGDPDRVMSIRKGSNYQFDPSDTNLSGVFSEALAGEDVLGWYYVVNGIRKEIYGILDYSFPWQAALTEAHKASETPTCTAWEQHYALYSLYPITGAKTYSVKFFDAYGNELSDYTNNFVEYQRSAYPPTNLSSIKDGKTMLFHSGWIDSADGLQANLAEVMHDMKCIPYYTQSIQDSNGVIETDDLKKYMVQLIQMQCDNVDEFYVQHEYYKTGYSRAYGRLRRTVDSKSFKYLAHVTTETLEKNVSDYMSQVDTLLDEYKGKIMTMGLVFLYYLAVLYFIKNTVVYVHGYKHENIGDYNACHVMYVPDNVPDFEPYIRNFSLIDDTIEILAGTQDSYDVIYDYSMIV